MLDKGRRVLVIDSGVLYHLLVSEDCVWTQHQKNLLGFDVDRSGHRLCGEYLLMWLDGVVAAYHWPTNSTFYRFIDS